jgi:hypothetical protein
MNLDHPHNRMCTLCKNNINQLQSPQLKPPPVLGLFMDGLETYCWPPKSYNMSKCQICTLLHEYILDKQCQEHTAGLIFARPLLL